MRVLRNHVLLSQAGCNEHSSLISTGGDLGPAQARAPDPGNQSHSILDRVVPPPVDTLRSIVSFILFVDILRIRGRSTRTFFTSGWMAEISLLLILVGATFVLTLSVVPATESTICFPMWSFRPKIYEAVLYLPFHARCESVSMCRRCRVA